MKQLSKEARDYLVQLATRSHNGTYDGHRFYLRHGDWVEELINRKLVDIYDGSALMSKNSASGCLKINRNGREFLKRF